MVNISEMELNLAEIEITTYDIDSYYENSDIVALLHGDSSWT